MPALLVILKRQNIDQWISTLTFHVHHHSVRPQDKWMRGKYWGRGRGHAGPWTESLQPLHTSYYRKKIPLPENQNFNTRSVDPLVVGILVSVRQTLLKTVPFAISGWQIDAQV